MSGKFLNRARRRVAQQRQVRTQGVAKAVNAALPYLRTSRRSGDCHSY
jgi:hypothetical protein